MTNGTGININIDSNYRKKIKLNYCVPHKKTKKEAIFSYCIRAGGVLNPLKIT